MEDSRCDLNLISIGQGALEKERERRSTWTTSNGSGEPPRPVSRLEGLSGEMIPSLYHIAALFELGLRATGSQHCPLTCLGEQPLPYVLGFSGF